MEELVDHLEKSVQSLLEEHILLKQENAVLQKQFRALLNEKNELIAKNIYAVGRIEQILKQLQSLVKKGDRPVAPTALANKDEQPIVPTALVNEDEQLVAPGALANKDVVASISDTLLIDEQLDFPNAEDSL